MSEGSETLEGYDAVVELYNSGRVSSQVKNDLKGLLEDNYVEKYTRPVMKSSDLFMCIKLEGEIVSLFGDEITVRNIREILDEEPRV